MKHSIASLLLLLSGLFACYAGPVHFKDVDTSFHAGKKSALLKSIDGIDASREGWSVSPQVSLPHNAIFLLQDPVIAGRLRLSLCFLSGQQNSHFNEFALSTTSDPSPSFESNWETLTPWLAYSTGTKLETLPHGRLQSKGSALNTEFLIEALVAPSPITAIRIDVFPVQLSPDETTSYVSASEKHDFVLTEFRVEAFANETTNIALGAPVKATHQLWGPFRPEYLTDGLPATFAHPRAPNLGDQFHFEIDLGKIRQLDHLVLRGRGDMLAERLSMVTLKLFQEPTDSDIEPIWIGHYREDGSYPPLGVGEVVRSNAGQGTMWGRYLQISSNSPIANSPQLAEVEAYESILPKLINLRADDKIIPLSDSLKIGPGIRWLAFSLSLTQKYLPKGIPIRWRFSGFHTDWEMVRADGIAEGSCPPPGSYEFEAQVAHTDGEWNQKTLRIPVFVARHWWTESSVQIASVALGIIASILIIRYLARHRLTVQVQQLERLHALDEERARIARDMHDVVGARLTQLSVMHDIFAKEHQLTPAADKSLHRLTRTAREAISALDEVVWTVNPRNDSLANLADYLCHCATEYLHPLDIPCHQDVQSDWEPRQVQAQVRHEILLAFKEALQNVAKHANASEVLLSLSFTAGIFSVKLEDNGQGLPEALSGTEKDGLLNMQTRLKSVKGTCTITARAGGGTTVQMHVPL